MTVPVQTKFLRLRAPAALGDRIQSWRLCWLGGGDRGRIFFVWNLFSWPRVGASRRRRALRAPERTVRPTALSSPSSIPINLSTCLWAGGQAKAEEQG